MEILLQRPSEIFLGGSAERLVNLTRNNESFYTRPKLLLAEVAVTISSISLSGTEDWGSLLQCLNIPLVLLIINC